MGARVEPKLVKAGPQARHPQHQASNQALRNEGEKPSHQTLVKEAPRNSNPYNVNPCPADAAKGAEASNGMVTMGARVDPRLAKAGAQAHRAPIPGFPANGVLPEGKLTAINAALGSMVAPESEPAAMDVRDSVVSLVDDLAPAHLMSTANEGDARNAYQALVAFPSVAEASPIVAFSASAPIQARDRLCRRQALSCGVSAD